MSFSTIKIKFTQELLVGNQVGFDVNTNPLFGVPTTSPRIENFVITRTNPNEVTTPYISTFILGEQTAINYYDALYADLSSSGLINSYGYQLSRAGNEVTITVENVYGTIDFYVNGLFASYKNPTSVQFTTNNQYTPGSSVTPTSSGSNQIQLYWNGATDDNGISGYQLQWRTSTTLPWSSIISVNHNANSPGNTSKSGGGSYSHSATQLVNHFFRIRIVDSFGQYSGYKEIIANVDASVILISNTGTTSAALACSVHPLVPVNPVLLSPLSPLNFIVPYSTYVKHTDNSVFNGLAKYWRILLSGTEYGCKVELDGQITEVVDCSLTGGGGTMYHSENISSTGVTTVVTNGFVCDLTMGESIYFTGVLGVGTIIYSVADDGGNLSDPFLGANKFYVVGSSIVKISSSPVGKVLSIQDYSSACPPVNTCCFVKGTKVSMFDNTNKNIEDVKIGDIVITYNEETKLQEPGEVTNIASPVKNNIVEYKLSNSVIIKSTTCHPYWVVNKGWSSFNPFLTKRLYNFNVEQIEEKDILLTIDNKEVIIDKITELITKEVTTYNLEILGNHTYYVNGILVHNKTALTEPPRYDQFGNETQEWITWNNEHLGQLSCYTGG